MIDVNSTFLEGVDAQSRIVHLAAELDITPQNIRYDDMLIEDPSDISPYAIPDQIHDRNSNVVKHSITSEQNRWIIGDMTFSAYDRIGSDVERGFETLYKYGEGCTPEERTSSGSSLTPDYRSVGYEMSNVTIVQAIRIDFPNNVFDGYPVDFDIHVGNASYWAINEEIRDNRSRSFILRQAGSASYPTRIVIDVYKWSLPNRRMRVIEMWVGLHETWYDDMFSAFSIQQKGTFVPFSLPYSTCSLDLDNSEKLFDPTNKQGLFLSIEERQPIVIKMAIYDYKNYPGTPYNLDDYETIGVFYQYSGGWKTGNSSLSIRWNLVDLFGLLVDRTFDTTKLPIRYEATGEIDLSTVEEWVEAVLSQLGKKFSSLYEIPYDYASFVLPPVTLDKFSDCSCGDVLLWLCQAINGWMRTTPDGKLYIGGFDRLGQDLPARVYDLSYDNINRYPSLQANDDLARIDFEVYKEDRLGRPYGDSYTYPVYGVSTASSNTESVKNPFVWSEELATNFADYALSFYGGNQIETVGRGNPALELGDLIYTEINNGSYMLGRIIEQTFEISDHVMKNCKTRLICTDEQGYGDYNAFEVFTRPDDTPSVEWRVPDNIATDEDGKSTIKVILVQAGQTGGHAGYTQWDARDEKWTIGSVGEHGVGGRIRIVELTQVFKGNGSTLLFKIGRAAEPRSSYIVDPRTGKIYFDSYIRAMDGEHTLFGINGDLVDSSENGEIYPNGFVDLVSGKRLGRSARSSPYPDSGDGGMGGHPTWTFLGDEEQGEEGPRPEDFDGRSAFAGSLGTRGANGCAIVCYKTVKEE